MTPGANMAFGRCPSFVMNFFSGAWPRAGPARPRATTTGESAIQPGLAIGPILDTGRGSLVLRRAAQCIRAPRPALSPIGESLEVGPPTPQDGGGPTWPPPPPRPSARGLHMPHAALLLVLMTGQAAQPQ